MLGRYARFTSPRREPSTGSDHCSMALASIEEARTLVQRVYGAFGIDLEWESVDPVQLRIALLQVRQWKNGMKEGGSLALEKGKPVAGAAAKAVAWAALTALAKGRFKPRG